MNQPVKLQSIQQQPPEGGQQQPTAYENLKRQLERSKAEFKPLLGGSDANVDAFIRVVLNAVLGNADLLGADRLSLIASCMKAAQDGLMPDGREAVLNIYSVKVKDNSTGRENWVKKVQYLPMVGGLVKLMYESGQVTSVDAAAVFANDRFVWRRGDEPKLEHEPTLADDCGAMIAAYCVVRLTNGDIKREVMPLRDIRRVQAVSKSGDGASSPWVKWPDQMAIKSVIHRINKQLPRSNKLENSLAADNEALGFAGTPESVATIAARAALAATQQGGMQALTHQPADPLELDVGAGSREAVRVDTGSVGDDPPPAWEDGERRAGDPPAPSPAPAQSEHPAGITFDMAAFRQRIERCTDLDMMAVLTDETRSIPRLADRNEAAELCRTRHRELQEAATARPAPPARRTGTGTSTGRVE